jgi:hypothetical protein
VSDFVEWQSGRPAWEPTPESTLLEVFHRYDMPLAGLFEQHGCTFGFSCVHGEVNVHQLFAVACITESSRRDLLSVPAEQRSHVLRDLLETSPTLRVLIHHEDKGIVLGVDVDLHGGDLIEQTLSSINDLVSELTAVAETSTLSPTS